MLARRSYTLTSSFHSPASAATPLPATTLHREAIAPPPVIPIEPPRAETIHIAAPEAHREEAKSPSDEIENIRQWNPGEGLVSHEDARDITSSLNPSPVRKRRRGKKRRPASPPAIEMVTGSPFHARLKASTTSAVSSRINPFARTRRRTSRKKHRSSSPAGVEMTGTGE